MAGLTVSGLVSGLDVNNIVDSLVGVERDPATARLDLRQLEIDAELSAIGTLKARLSAFRDAASPLAFASTFRQLSAGSSDTDVLTASATTVAKPGSYNIEVSQLAQAHSLASKAFESTTDAIGEGTLSIRFGSYDSGTNTFTANPDKIQKSIVLDATNNSLQGIRDTINGSNLGVQASIVNDGSGFRLVLRADDTGTKNSLELTVSGDVDGLDTDDAGLSQLAFDPTAAGAGNGKNLSETVVALDANFLVDGLAITKASNSVSDVIEGVTLTLTGESSGQPVVLDVARNTSALRGAIDGFLSSFNNLALVMDELGGFDPEEQRGGILVGDSMLRTLQNQLRSVVGGIGAGLNGPVRSLADLGITTDASGRLLVSNQESLNSALADHPDDVAGLFSAVGRNDDPLIDFLSSSDVSKAGSYAVDITTLATRGTYQGIASSSLVVDASNDTLQVAVDGTASGTISLSQKTYASGAELATELQVKINSDSILQAAGFSVEVSYAGGQFEITSSRFGSASTVSIAAVDTTTTATLGLGITVGTSTAGVDVAGTIGGVAATGSGRLLTGSGDAAGLVIEVLGGATGSRSSINFSRGFADTLLDTLDAYLESSGVIEDREASLQARSKSVDSDRENLDARMDALEERLRTQFAQLELALAQLQNTSDFLAQQLKVLEPIRNSE